MLASAAIFFANYGILISAFALVAAAWLHRGQRWFLLPFAIGATAAIGLDLLAGRLYFELRPFAQMHVAPLVAHDPLDNSFPSDHAAASAYAAGFLAFVDRRWALVALAAMLLVSEARVICLLHWQHDVVAGWLIGAIPGLIAGYWGRRRGPQA